MVAKCVYNIWMVLREGTSSPWRVICQSLPTTMAIIMQFGIVSFYRFFRISILPRASSESAVMSKFDQHYVKSFSKPQPIASKQYRNNTKRHKK